MVTLGDCGWAEARIRMFCVEVAWPSETWSVTTKSPACDGPGVHWNWPVFGSSVAPAGRLSAE